MFINSGAEAVRDQTWGGRCLDVTRYMAIAAAGIVPASTAAASLAIFLMMAAWLASGRMLETLRLSASQLIGQVLLLFMGLLFVDVLYSPVPWSESWSSLWAWRKLLLGFVVLGLFAEDIWKLRLLKTVVSVSALGLAASWIGWLAKLPPKPCCPVGVYFTNQTSQGMIFAVSVLVCLELIRVMPPRWHRWLRAAAVLFALNIVFISPSRSAYAALACVSFVYMLNCLGWRRLPMVVGMLILFVATSIGLSSTMRERIQQGIKEVGNYQVSADLTSGGARIVFWTNSLALVAERPLLGYGTGSYAAIYRDRFVNPQLGLRGIPSADPHNQYLFVAVENGLLGLAVFLGIIAIACRDALGLGNYRVIVMGVLLTWCVTSLFNSHFRTFPEGHFIWLLVGALLSRLDGSSSARLSSS
jgi:O-antigen ligase